MLEKMKYRDDGEDDVGNDADRDDVVCDVIGDWRGDRGLAGARSSVPQREIASSRSRIVRWGLSCAMSPVSQSEIASSSSRVVESIVESVSETIWYVGLGLGLGLLKSSSSPLEMW